MSDKKSWKDRTMEMIGVEGENPMLKENQKIWPAAKARIPEFVKRESKSKQKTT